MRLRSIQTKTIGSDGKAADEKEVMLLFLSRPWNEGVVKARAKKWGCP